MCSLPDSIKDFRGEISKNELLLLAKNKDFKVLQTSRPAQLSSWVLINEELLSTRPDITIRVYGHYSQNCDLSFISELSNAEHLSIDCLTDATNIQELKYLKNLKSLSVGIYNLDSFDFLNYIPQDLEKLFLGRTKSKKPNLDYLSRFTKLKILYLEGQQKNIDVIENLVSLEQITFRSITVKNLAFLRKLKNLWYLDIKLGGTKDFASLCGLRNIKYLELWQIRGLSDISFISELYGLQYLFLQSLPNVKCIPDLSQLKELRRIYFENLKGLENITGVVTAHALEEFIHVAAINMQPEQYADLFKKKSLIRVAIGFGSDKKNRTAIRMMQKCGLQNYEYSNFEFK